jgi:beta-lactamase regulating signal transducer with metallopeptidase domain
MSQAELSIGHWLIQSALSGGLILLLTWAAMRWIRQPARRQRFGEIGVAAALAAAVLSLAPAWLVVSVPVPTSPAPTEMLASAQPNEPEIPAVALEDYLAFAPDPEEAVVPPISESPPSEFPVASTTSHFNWGELPWLSILAVTYIACAGLLLVRWLVGYFGLWRMLRSAESAPVPVHRLFTAMTCEDNRPHLFVVRRLQVPLSCGLLRPTIVLPASLCEAPPSKLRWIFAHELTHLERRDPWTCLLFALAQAVFFYVPWFWSVRRQVQLCQEYVADATAAAEAEQRADYAEFLLTLTASPTAPACASGVSGHPSDLYRRITMLLQNHQAVERRCPRLWSLATAGSLLAMAVLVAGVGFRATAAPPGDDRVALNSQDDNKKDEPKKDQPNKDDKKKDEPKKEDKKKTAGDEPKKERKGIFGGGELPDFEEILKNLPQNLDPEKLAEIRKQLQEMRGEMRKRIEEMRRNMPENVQGRFPFRGGMRALAVPHQGRFGVRVEPPSSALADQLDLPKGRGLVIHDVVPDSPAAKAGIKPHDILLSLGARSVTNDPTEFAEMINEMKPDAPFDVTVKRKGKDETIKGITLPEQKLERKPLRRNPGSIREILPFTPPPVKSDAVFDGEAL